MTGIPVSTGVETATWDELMEEARAFEAWYGTRMGVNAWVGIDTLHGFYGGWSIEGDPLTFDEWDESEMTTASGDTPGAVRADLIKIARSYRRRNDEQRAEDEADRLAYAAEQAGTP